MTALYLVCVGKAKFVFLASAALDLVTLSDTLLLERIRSLRDVFVHAGLVVIACHMDAKPRGFQINMRNPIRRRT